ncbi:MAG: type IV toxin-antitoxin system AbiEi family antitoxin domain-containing protein [Candidatus Micrarchaeia archaeon]
MDSKTFISKLSSLDIFVFSIDTASTILDKPHNYTSLYLQRLLKAHKIGRLEKNKYYLLDADIYTIASRILPYSYISMYTALEHYSLTTQIPKAIEIIAFKYHKKMKIAQHDIVFSKVKKSFIYGYIAAPKGPVFAEPEKIFIDDLYLHGRLYFSEEFEYAIKRKLIDIEKLCSYAIRSGKGSVVSLLGHYLESFDINADELLPYRSKSYIKLSKNRRLDARWRIYW